LASSDQRDHERVPTFLRVRLRFADVDTFIEKYSTNVSLGGVFIQSRSPKPPGTTLRFELALESGEVLIKGEGQVTWVREFDADSPGQPFGMGVRFTNLDAKSRALVERAVAHRQARAGSDATPSGFTPGATRLPRGATKPAAAPSPPPPAPITPHAPKPPEPASSADADAALEALMREAGLDSDKIARATARAAARVAQEPSAGALGALLRPRRAPSGAVAAPAAAEARADAAPRPVTPAEDLVIDAAPPTTPRPREGHAVHEAPVLPEADIDEMLGGFTPTPPPTPGSAEAVIVGADLEIESLGSPLPRAARGAHGHVEITAVGTPPRFDESIEAPDEPLVFPDREVTTPPPETASTFLAADATVTPPEPVRAEGTPEPVRPAPVNATERWAAAAGPETANLEAELVAALDSVMDRTQETPAGARPPTSPPTAESADDRGQKKKGILGRIFRKKG
jgi:uncharacterized protein (TIGR02266 family)